MRIILFYLSIVEDNRILYIGVKSNNLWRNVSGESGYLDYLLTLMKRKHREQTGLDTLVVYAVKYEC
jgi:hypothetical protein